MGKFSGYLIVSDIDGTLCDAGSRLSEANREALEYFKSEGGLFTLASGRTLTDVTAIDDTLRLANTVLIGSNGALVGRGKEVLWQCRFDERLPHYVKKLLDAADYCDAEFVTPEYIAYYRPNRFTDLHRYYVSDRFVEIASLSDIPQDTAMVAFWLDEERIPAFRELFSQVGADAVYAAFQGFTYAYEMVPKGFGKGAAACRVKAMNDCHTLICAGDSGNDVSMLLAADLSFAPQNAMQEAKDAAQVTLSRTCGEAIYPEILEFLLKKA